VSSERWLLSVLIVIHLVAISASSIPDPHDLNAGQSETPGAPDSLASFVTPALDRAVVTLASFETQVFRLTVPVRALTRMYIQAGLRQKWDMFANPMTADQYVRVVHYIEAPHELGRIRVFRELVLPAQHEDRVRLIHKFRDKAVLNSFETFTVNRRDHPETNPELALKPIAAYFGQQFTRRYLALNETVVRTEVWFGVAEIPLTGHRAPDVQLQNRRVVLQRYWDGPVQDFSFVSPSEPGSVQSESDIVWRLGYIEKP
jgi:hypothetical protein